MKRTFHFSFRPKASEAKPGFVVLSRSLIVFGLVAGADARDMPKMPGMERSQAAATLDPCARVIAIKGQTGCKPKGSRQSSLGRSTEIANWLLAS